MVERETIRRERMIRQLRERGIRDAGVLDAMAAVPREAFVEEALRGKAYSDVSLPIGEKQTISQPYIVARMTELLEPSRGARVLEIGTGSGYQAAVLSRVFELVYSVERSPALSRRARETVRTMGFENIHFKIFDGSYGWSEFAPYPAILVTAAVPEIPGPLVEQLDEEGRMVLPLARGGETPQTLVRLVRRRGRIVTEEHGPCRFVPLVGRFGMEA